MRLKTKEQIIEITEKTPGMEKYVDEGDKFSIKVKNIGLKESTEIQKELDKADTEGEAIYKSIVSVANKSIIGWEGLYDEDGEEIPYNKKNLGILIENSTEFISDIINITQKEFSKSKKK